MRLWKLNILCIRRHNQQQSKRQLTEWKKRFVNHISDGLIARLYEEFLKFNNKKSDLKMGEGIKIFLQKHMNGQNNTKRCCSTSLLIRETLIKTIRYHFPSMRMALERASGPNFNVGEGSPHSNNVWTPLGVPQIQLTSDPTWRQCQPALPPSCFKHLPQPGISHVFLTNRLQTGASNDCLQLWMPNASPGCYPYF